MGDNPGSELMLGGETILANSCQVSVSSLTGQKVGVRQEQSSDTTAMDNTCMLGRHSQKYELV